jgi:hypothetical protein
MSRNPKKSDKQLTKQNATTVNNNIVKFLIPTQAAHTSRRYDSILNHKATPHVANNNKSVEPTSKKSITTAQKNRHSTNTPYYLGDSAHHSKNTKNPSCTPDTTAQRTQSTLQHNPPADMNKPTGDIMLNTKPPQTLRLYFQNVSGINKLNWEELKELTIKMRELNVDIIGCTETNIAWQHIQTTKPPSDAHNL